MTNHKLSFWTRTIGIITIAAGAVLCVVQVYAMIFITADHLLDYAVRAAAYLLIGVGVGAALVAMAHVLGTKVDPTGAFLASLQHLQTQFDQLNLRIGTMAANIESDKREASNTSNAPLIEPEMLIRMEHLLHEIRELSLLGDNDRRLRLTHHLEQRKRQMSRQIMDSVSANEFARAEKILTELESQFPNDAYAVGCRRDLDMARRANETQLVRVTAEKIEHQIDQGQWDQALMAATHLVDNFPKNPQARELLSRASREREVFIETNAQAQYEEVRRHIEHRSWRLALVEVQKLLAKYPNHHRAQQMRGQLRTIQENADIEERQEAEVRIQEMIRSGQFRDAIDLAEDVIRRFPGSPQADAIEAMLPRLQELAGEPQAPIA
jgi:hypothetical protein